MIRPSYANVVATLALVVALGGTSYAATQITGKDVKNGSLSGKDVKDKSLTGKDVKQQSIPLDRLSGSLPSQLDPGLFLPSTGPYTISAGAGGWESTNTSLRRQSVFGGWVSSSIDDQALLLLDPSVPTTIAGKAMRLRAVTLCRDATTTAMINSVIISTFREDANGNTVDVAEIVDPDDHVDKTCKRYAFATPVTLAGSSRVSLRLGVAWSASGATISVGGATLEMDRG